MIDLELFFKVILFITLIILVVALIIAVIKIIKILSKVDVLVDDVQNKSSKLDGAFDIANNVTTAITTVSDKIGGFITDKVNKITKKGEEDE